MKILIAPDKFKGSLTGPDVARVIRRSLLDRWPALRIDEQPIADGGEGTAELLTIATGGRLLTAIVSDPLFQPVTATYGISGDGQTAFIEMAQASGLALLSGKERNPLQTSTLGTGELIRAAIRQGVRRVILCIGGSATNDAGIGMAAALGYRFFDADGNLVKPIGQHLGQIQQIDTSDVLPELAKTEFLVACDVDNPLYGPNGAAHVYGPQKGADAEVIRQLDSGMRHLAGIIWQLFGREVAHEPGSGAAGGLGYGARVFLNAELQGGFRLIAGHLNLEQRIAEADLVVTGEGKLDEQTLAGKVIGGLAQIARRQRIPVVAFCGRLDLSPQQIQTLGLTDAIAITPVGMLFQEAVGRAEELLAAASQSWFSRYVAKKEGAA